jgi:polar amino acid transport system substrate-binding protein
MKFTYYVFIIAILVTTPVFSKTSPLSNKAVIFCVESDEWPPYNFIERIDGQKTGKPIGYDIDLVRKILAKHQITAQFKALHWNRCLSETKKGERIQVSMSAASTLERRRDFLFTNSYYHLTPAYFYSRQKFPNGLSINAPSDLLEHGNICGRLGYSYQEFGIKSKDINKTPVTYIDLVNMLMGGRCTIFLARLETFAGLTLIGSDYVSSKQLAYNTLPNSTLEPFYMLISKRYKYAKELKLILDQGFIQMDKTGFSQQLLKKYLSSSHP